MKKLILFLTLGIVISLMACSSSPMPKAAADLPQLSDTASPLKIHEAKNKINSIIVDADNLIINLNGGENKIFPYNDSPTALITYLGKTFKQQPLSSYNDQGYLCWSTTTTVSWGNLHILYEGQNSQQTINYMVNVSDEKPLTNMAITTPLKATIGLPLSEYIKQIPTGLTKTAHANKNEYEWVLEKHSTYVPPQGDPSNNYGLVIFSVNGKVKNISSPFPFTGNC